MRRLAAVVVVGMGCSGDSSGPDSTTESTGAETAGDTATSTVETGTTPIEDVAAFTDGTRLSAIYEEANGEAAQLRRWWDAERQTTCRPTMDENFDLRCLPDVQVSLVYLDEACTELAFEVSPCDDEPPAYVTAALPERCVGPSRGEAFGVGASVTASEVYLTGSCQRIDLGSEVVHRRVTRVSDAEFVGFVPRHVAFDGGLGVRMLDGEDGSSQRFDLVATEPDQVCNEVILGEDEASYCLHGDLTYDFGNLHADASCETGGIAYGIGAAACDPPTHALVYERLGGECGGYVANLHDVGPVAAAPHVGSPGFCSPANLSSSTYYEVGPAVANDLPELRAEPVGEGRLQTIHYVTPSGQPLVASVPSWYDTKLGAACSSYETETHGRRCLPTLAEAVEGSARYADAACTVPLVEVFDDPCSNAPEPQLYGFRPVGTCGGAPLRDVRPVAKPYEGKVYLDNGVSCTVNMPKGRSYYTVGEPVSLDDYAAITTGSGPSVDL